MSKPKDLQNSLLSFVSTAVDLANSVKDDIKEQRHVSDETILLLNKFMKQHNELDTILDIVRGIN